MRLKTFTASTMSAAMALVREQLGDDAIIVSTQRGEHGRGVRVTAALDGAVPDYAPGTPEGDAVEGDALDLLTERLDRHGATSELTDRLVRAAGQLISGDPVMVLAGAVDATFGFAPLPEDRTKRPLMLVGSPGVGKTLTVAKLATRAVMARKTPIVITTDIVRAGAIEQLAAFTRLLKIELKTCATPKELAAAIMAAKDCPVFIDSPGTNPFNAAEMDELATFLRVGNIEPILVLAAGGDPAEAIEIADAFKAVGATRLLATKLDMTRRLGSILVAADGARLKLCDVSATAQVAEGLSPINPVSLARLLLPDLGKNAKAPSGSKAYA
jgi:flagellar biosynthesis protein FlhF